jgi:hypothetical protein
MQKAGLEAEIARLERLHAAHIDDQHAIRSAIRSAEQRSASAMRRISEIEQDIAIRIPTRGDAFSMKVEGKSFSERKEAGAALLQAIRYREFERKDGTWSLAEIGGFEISFTAKFATRDQYDRIDVDMHRTGTIAEIDFSHDLTALGFISRLEYMLSRFEVELAEEKRTVADAEARLPGYRQRLGETFSYAAELDTKRQELAEIDAALAAQTSDAPATEPDLADVTA